MRCDWFEFTVGSHTDQSHKPTAAADIRCLHDDVMAWNWKHFPQADHLCRESTCHTEGNPPITKRESILYKGPVIRSVVDSFVVSLNKLLNRQLSRQWFETSWCSCEVTAIIRCLPWPGWPGCHPAWEPGWACSSARRARAGRDRNRASLAAVEGADSPLGHN